MDMDFLKTLGNSEIAFLNVITGLRQFLEPVWNAILTENEFLKESEKGHCAETLSVNKNASESK